MQPPKNPPDSTADENRDLRSKSDLSAGLGPDSKLVYITCHLISALYNLTVAGALIWLAYYLQTGWVLLGMLVIGKSYRHDFNGLNGPRKAEKADGA